MKYTTPTGTAIIGTLEELTATAVLHVDADGCIELPRPLSDYTGTTRRSIHGELCYTGSTHVDWESQQSACDHRGEVIFVDEDGEQWSLSQLVPLAPEPIQVVGSDQSPPLNPCSS